MLIFTDLGYTKSENNSSNPRTNFVLHGVMGQNESLRIILKKIGVFVMWATCLKKLMKQVTLKGEKDLGDIKVAGLKITSMQSKS